MLDALPQAISSYAPGIDSLLHYIYFLTGIFFVGLEIYLVYLIFRYRQRDGVKAQYEPGSKAQIQWILAFTVIVMILDFTIDVKGGKVWDTVKEDMPACDLTVKVVAKQFDWTFLYPGKDGTFGPDSISSYRELHVPVGKKVHVILTSKDVIHDFFLPEVRLKQDVMPGREIDQWFDTNQTGTFHIVCDELCGFGHTRMTGVLQVDDEKTFEDWKNKMYQEQHGGAQ
jgi:cytochrome c oxidase subunit II